ncbi:hydrogenase-4 component B [Clostridium homopropionicum DSM 5847]|uniref:Hydrogenase-4 component B n=1 Tax=Clostridium homopropionicum DSM 5847 TaxID=1121318 RepID=A0A0L6Z907_9CLOT|nr:proton-conducting transporter membrane subunit [Clostridium homopropionicum]KOA19258.1 hydrogenase-4 component B [Clostridium homopropionicum DSM 5847]SFG18985.1 hydrogenase-4 component F [Clostridium homopropionicum]
MTLSSCGIIFIVVLLLTILLKNIKTISILTILNMLMLIVVSALLYINLKSENSLLYYNDLIYIDSLNIIQFILISTISFIASIYSYKYIKEELEDSTITINFAKVYYFLFNLFVLSMIAVAISNNIILMWISLEATTLSTALLIGFNRSKLSLEAAWKYIIICSIGIVLGLVGIILFIYASTDSTQEVLKWNYLIKNYGILNKDMIKFGFCFIFIGIATKAGLAPMHTWLPDGHSEAPSPISAMMSGLLLNLALYVVIRFYIVVSLIPGLEKMKYLFIVFGLISLVVSAFSILKQNNYKRLLAFSSVENMGIITLGFGIGGPIAVYGSLLHSIIHAYGKSLLFLVSGNILKVYKTKRIDRVNNLIKTMPINAVFLILGILVITGMPPFASFFSEYNILMAAIKNGNYLTSALYCICILIVFGGFLKVFINMIYSHDKEFNTRSKEDKENIIPLIILFITIVAISLLFTKEIAEAINKAVLIINGK